MWLKSKPLPRPRRPLMLHLLLLLLSYSACHSQLFSVSVKMYSLTLFSCCLPNMGDHFLFSLTSVLVSHLSNLRLRDTFFQSSLYTYIYKCQCSTLFLSPVRKPCICPVYNNSAYEFLILL